MNIMKRLLEIAIIISSLGTNVSCFLSNPAKELHPPPTFPLSRTVLGYVVITDSFTQLLDRPGSEGVSLGVLRKGTILPVLERRMVQDNNQAERWIFVSAAEKGWVRESAGQVFQHGSPGKNCPGYHS